MTIFAAALPGQDNAELLAHMKEMEARIQALEAEVQALKAQAPATAPEAAPVAAQAPAAVAAPVTYGGAGAAASKVFNPDISVIGDFIGAAGNGQVQPTPGLEMHETELGLQAIIDPYARGDIFLSFGREGVELEEGYLTFVSLPAELQARVGKMRAAFGKVNTMHNHTLSWIDRPLVTDNLVAGEEGISDEGVSVSRILPAPGELFLEGTAQVFRGETEGLFGTTRRRDLSVVGHLRGYRDLSESTNMDIGVSYARGHSPLADDSNQLYGIDATVRWKPLRRAIYQSFLGRTEFVWARSQSPDLAAGPFGRPISKPFGFYVSGDYQAAQRWTFGARFDRSERLLDQRMHDTGGSLVFTYKPSEFSLLRLQLRRTRYAENVTANEALFQLQFAMGAHGAHPF